MNHKYFMSKIFCAIINYFWTSDPACMYRVIINIARLSENINFSNEIILFAIYGICTCMYTKN